MKISWPSRSTFVHMRFLFSFFLTPILFFALSQISDVAWPKALAIFALLGFAIFPASQAYNSYYDRDEGSIGGLERPPQVTEDLLFYSLLLEGLGLLVAFRIWGLRIAVPLFIYGIFSKLYSHPAVRLKSRPVLGFLTVALLQGFGIYAIVVLASQPSPPSWLDFFQVWRFFGPALASMALIGASYPLTQVYQHDEDAARGDLTLSRLLGVRYTFLFSFSMFALAFFIMAGVFGPSTRFALLIISTSPALIFGLGWARRVWACSQAADFKTLHRFMFVSTTLINVGFIGILLLPLSASATEPTVYKGKSSEPWFTMETTKTDVLMHTTFSDPEGKTLSDETITYGRDGKWQKYQWQQKQTLEEARIELEGQKLKYFYKSKEAKSRENSEILDAAEIGRLVLPPQIADFALQHWDEIVKGDRVEMLVIAPDRRETFRFHFHKRATESKGEEVFMLSPNNVFVSLAISPIPFVFSKDKRLLRIEGFLPPVKFRNKAGSLESKNANVTF